MATLLSWEIGLFLCGLAVVVFYQMLTGKIHTRGLLREKNGKGELSWGRIQLLLFTIIFAFIYLFHIFTNPTKFPEIPQKWLLVLGGSNLVYLGEKTFKLLIRSVPK